MMEEKFGSLWTVIAAIFLNEHENKIMRQEIKAVLESLKPAPQNHSGSRKKKIFGMICLFYYSMFLMEKNEAILLFNSNSCKQDSEIARTSKVYFVRQVWDKGIELLTWDLLRATATTELASGGVSKF